MLADLNVTHGNFSVSGHTSISGNFEATLGNFASFKILTAGANHDGTYPVQISGNTQVTGSLNVTESLISRGVTIYSDQRLKENIVTLNDNDYLNKLEKMRPVRYTLINKNADSFLSKEKYGLIAQEVQEIFPNMVTDTNPLAVDYIQLIPFIPCLYKRVIALEKEMEELKKKINK